MPPLPFPRTALRAVSRLPLQQSRRLLLRRVISIPRSNRYSSTSTSGQKPLKDSSSSASSSSSSSHKPQAPTRLPQPEYEMTFTCTPCSTRSTHRVSKQGYHHGSVLITCPECRNRHIVSDHLHIFGDRHITIEDLMRERGQLVKKGTLSEDGDVEFWDDGTNTKRVKGGDSTTPDGQVKELD